MLRFATLSLFFAVLISTAAGQAQESLPGDAAIEKWLAGETAEVSSAEFASLSRENFELQRAELKRQYLDMLGLWPLPERTPLKATVTGTVQRDAFTVENVHFQSRPGLYVTGNLYLPNPLPKEKLPAVLYVCGHSGRGRDGNKTAFQHHGMWFATHGYVCLIIDTLQLGEVAGIHHGTYSQNRFWWHSVGYTPAGVECWNGVRAIDYLVSRPEVDAGRIACTGISGGGAATFWITAADDRVKVCAPVSGMSDLASYVNDKVINGHCDCMFLYNAYRWEWTTIAALVVPRPMLFENSGHDTIFPMPGNERIRTRLETLYNQYQKKPGDLFDIGVTPGGHEDNLELRLMAYRWINRHLQSDNAEVQEPVLPKIEGKALRAFPLDSDLPQDSLNSRIDESFVTLARHSVPAGKAAFDDWSNQLRGELLTKVFRDWPEEVLAATVRERGRDGAYVLQTDDEISIIARQSPGGRGPREAAIPEDKLQAPSRLWLIILNPEDAEGQIPEWARSLVPARDSVTVISPRGGGEHSGWTRKNPPNYVERAHALLGRTVDTLRVWDVQSTARWLHEAEGNSLAVGVIGKGPAGILGAYAAIFENCIADVVVVDPPASHREGPYFLNVMRVLDVPEALGMLAPRRLTIAGGKDELTQRVQAIYGAAGYADRLHLQAK